MWPTDYFIYLQKEPTIDEARRLNRNPLFLDEKEEADNLRLGDNFVLAYSYIVSL